MTPVLGVEFSSLAPRMTAIQRETVVAGLIRNEVTPICHQ